MTKPGAPPAPQAASLMALIWRTFGAVALAAGGSAIALVLHVAIARLGGPEPYADFAFLVSLANVIVMVALMGYDTRIPQDVAAQLAQGDRSAARRLLVRAATDCAGLSIIGVGCITLVASGRQPASAIPSTALVAAGVTVFALVLARLGMSLAAATGRVFAGLWPERILRDLTVLIVCGLTFFGFGELGISQVMLAVLAGAFAAAIFVLASQRATLRMLAHAPRGVTAEGESRRGATLLFALGGAASYFLMRSPQIVGAFVLAQADLALISAGLALAELAGFGITILAMMLTPEIARAEFGGKSAGVARLFLRGAGLSLLSTCLLSLGVIMAAPIFTAIFGRGFEGLQPVLMTLCLAQCARATGGVAVQILNARGRAGMVLAVQAAGALLSAAGILLFGQGAPIAAGLWLTATALLVAIALNGAVWLTGSRRFRAEVRQIIMLEEAKA